MTPTLFEMLVCDVGSEGGESFGRIAIATDVLAWLKCELP